MNQEDKETQELKKRIRTLENRLKREQSKNKKNNFPDKVKITQVLQEKELQIESQRNELLEKQNQLEESRDKYADLFDFAPIGYLTLNQKGVIIEINLTGASILGLEKRYILNIPFIHFLAGSDAIRFLDYLRKCKKINKLLVDEFTIKKNFKFLTMQTTSVPVYDYGNKELNFRISILDITDLKKVENELKESEKRFRLMADASPSMIWMLNENKWLEYANKTNLDFLGKSLDEIKESGFFELIHPDDRNKFREELSKSFEEKTSFVTEIRFINKSGKYRWILSSATPRWLPDGSFSGFIGSSIDITERREIREGLENSLKEKEILIKEVHHRVKNNLQIISSILSLQSHYTKNKPVDEILKGCKRRVLSMSLIHEQLYHSDDLVNIDFKTYAEALIKNLSNTFNFAGANISFKLDFDDARFNLETSISLGLILNELISNSLKYAYKEQEEGEIIISLKRKEDRKCFILKVIDNGRGLPKNFDLNNLRSLGLELVLSLVQQLHGELNIHRNGKTEFEIVMNI